MSDEEVAVAALAAMNNKASSNDTTVKVSDSEEQSSGQELSDAPTSQSSRAERHKNTQTSSPFPAEPRLIQVVQRPRAYMNHSYRDFSQVPPEPDWVAPKTMEDLSFSQKIHRILSKKKYEFCISWMPHGRAFHVHIPLEFEKKICMKYFGHKRYSSFLRQLNNYGFKHITKGPDRNCYYHEFMLRGLPHLAKYMPEQKTARRLIADPENEPNFVAISRKYPLPDDPDFGKRIPEPLPATAIKPIDRPDTKPDLKKTEPTRLASEVDWLQALMPEPKRRAIDLRSTSKNFFGTTESIAMLLQPPSIVPPFSSMPGNDQASRPQPLIQQPSAVATELKQAIERNNQLLAALALNSPPDAAAQIAAYLQTLRGNNTYSNTTS